MEQLVVRADLPRRRKRYRRMAWIVGIGYGIVAALFGVQMSLIAAQLHDNLLAALVPGAVAGVFGFFLGSLLLVSGALSRLRAAAAISRIMTVGADGLWFAHTQPLGTEVFLPWEIVGQVRRRPWLRDEMLMVKLRPGVARDHPGAYGLDDPKLWAALNDRGMVVGMRDIVPGKEQVVAAIGQAMGRPVEA